ncbi:hypothetical protein [Micromonospora vulcania]|uniref:Uncharacterized protein n=1 Tax=Micromonospora vulcania TaxID=1441873 RepID=A0ABW1H4E9_9ACTN
MPRPTAWHSPPTISGTPGRRDVRSGLALVGRVADSVWSGGAVTDRRR